MIKITFPDGATKDYEVGVSVLDIAKSISDGLARNVLSAKFNDHIVETSTIINEDNL